MRLGSDVDWIGWLDDDEAPHARWLAELVDTQRATDADVVMGPSMPIFESPVPHWLEAPFASAHFTTGASFPFNYARTSGIIMRASVVPEERFDHRLALTGGEDRVMFTRVHRNGGTFAWNDDAVVDEWIPESRASLRWLSQRWFRKGVTRSLAMLILDNPSWSRRLRRVVGGTGRGMLGIALTAWAARRGRGAAVGVAPRIFFGFGAAYGALGRDYQEYRKVHGS